MQADVLDGPAEINATQIQPLLAEPYDSISVGQAQDVVIHLACLKVRSETCNRSQSEEYEQNLNSRRVNDVSKNICKKHVCPCSIQHYQVNTKDIVEE